MPTVSPHRRRIFFSVGARLALTVASVLGVVSAVMFIELTARERRHLIAAKEAAGTMVVELFASSVSAPLQFADLEALNTEASHLQSNSEIAVIDVWGETASDPLVRWHRTPDHGSLLDVRPPSAPSSPDFVSLSRPVLDTAGRRIGEVLVAFSLEQENRTYEQNKRRLLFQALGLAFGTALLLIAIVRRQVVSPLRHLAQAAARLQRGEPMTALELRSNDEIGQLGDVFNMMGEAIADRTKRLEQELEIAARIQTSILPRSLEVEGLDVAARMVPATEVGGDYYEVLPVEGGCWFGIGDVSGHGLNAGVIMMMIQSIVSGLVRADPNSDPKQIVRVLNRTLVDNIRNRLQGDDHATFSLLRYFDDGRIVFAGAHEDIVLCRASDGRVEQVRTPGGWLGVTEALDKATVETSFRLAEGDTLLLYTDGATEAKSVDGQYYGLERICEQFQSVRSRGVDAICDHLVRDVLTWTKTQLDDITFVVIRRRAQSS